MGHHDHQAVLGILLQDLHHVKCILVVQGRGGFVSKDHLRVIDHGTCDGNSLTLSAGKLRRTLAELPLGQSEGRKTFRCLLLQLLLFADTGHDHIVHCRHVGHQIMLLKDKTELPAAHLLPLFIGKSRDLPVIVPDTALRRLLQRGHAVHEGALSASGGSDDAHQSLVREL